MARPEAFFKVMAAEASLKHYLPLVEKVIGQSRARIFQAQTRHPDKILSLFEPHSVVIRKGEAHKPNEFGRLVRIDEVENGLVSNYAVAPGNLCDQQQWVPALGAHVERFGRAPRLTAADRGFWNSVTKRLRPSWGSNKWFTRLTPNDAGPKLAILVGRKRPKPSPVQIVYASEPFSGFG